MSIAKWNSDVQCFSGVKNSCTLHQMFRKEFLESSAKTARPHTGEQLLPAKSKLRANIFCSKFSSVALSVHKSKR